MMREEVVTRRAWMTDAEFLDMVGATNLLPGPGSTQLAILIGLRRAGLPGSVVAGVCFITPAAAMVLALAWAYRTYGALPRAQAVLYGLKPVIIAIVIFAIRGLFKVALKNWWHAAIGVASLTAALLGWDVLLSLFAAGAFAAVIDWASVPRDQRQPVGSLVGMFGIASAMIIVPDALTRATRPAGTAAAVYGSRALFAAFLKVGMTIYGGGYVLIAFLRDQLVHQWHWLTERQLLDAIAVGQLTPGPLFTTATFIGYMLGGTSGALIATVAIFLPSFVLVAASGPLIPHLRRSRMAGAFLDGVNVAALALMAAVTGQLARAALVDIFTAALAVLSLALLFQYKINSMWLIGLGAVCGLSRSLI
jgi:chromate transporter